MSASHTRLIGKNASGLEMLNQWLPKTVCSGGQTGADLGGIVGAERAGIQTGGWAPKNFKTEVGSQPILQSRFGLREHADLGYRGRSRQNVLDSNATLIISPVSRSAGTKLTISFCEELGRPYCLISELGADNVTVIHDFLNLYKPVMLNIAGNRERVSPGLTAYTANLIHQCFLHSKRTQ